MRRLPLTLALAAAAVPSYEDLKHIPVAEQETNLDFGSTGNSLPADLAAEMREAAGPRGTQTSSCVCFARSAERRCS